MVPSLAPSAASAVAAALERDPTGIVDEAERIIDRAGARPPLSFGTSIRPPGLPSHRARRERLELLRVARHRRALGYWAVLIGMGLSLWVGTSVQVHDGWHRPFLFVHLASVIAGLGATVVLDAKAVQWVFGRATLGDVNRIERAVTPLAWLGMTGLLASGAFLAPDLGEPLTALKMVAVLVAALNGVAVGRLTDVLGRMPERMPFRRTPTRLKLWCAGSAAVSQLAWWCAVVLGMMNTVGR